MIGFSIAIDDILLYFIFYFNIVSFYRNDKIIIKLYSLIFLLSLNYFIYLFFFGLDYNYKCFILRLLSYNKYCFQLLLFLFMFCFRWYSYFMHMQKWNYSWLLHLFKLNHRIWRMKIYIYIYNWINFFNI